MHQPLDNLAHQLRVAVLGGDHAAGLRLVVEYGQAVREHWIALPHEERAASPVPQHSLELLAWVRDMTIVQRGMTSEHLGLVKKSLRYQTARSQYLQSAAIQGRSS